MKKVLFSIATIGIFISCNTNPKTETTTTTVIPAISNADSINWAQADKNQSVQMNGVSDTIIGSDGQMYVKAKQGTQPTTLPTAPAPIPTPARKIVKNQPSRVKHTTHSSSSNNNTNQGSGSNTTGNSNGTGSTANNGTGSNTGTETSTTQTEEPKKKGWSNAAKGTAIGAAGGAVAGAIISKNKGVGAVVGGLIGAGGGYIIGRKKDKKKQQTDSTANQ